MSTIDKTWHLAETEAEVQISEFELQLWRVFYGFERWQERCEMVANGLELTGNELAVLHIVRMKNRVKTINELLRLLNRDDAYSIHYSIRKLIKMGLIRKVPIPNQKKTHGYEITEEGVRDTDSYKEVRKSTLIDLFAKELNLNLEEFSRTLIRLKAIYDEADRVVASYTIPKEITPKNSLKKLKKLKKIS